MTDRGTFGSENTAGDPNDPDSGVQTVPEHHIDPDSDAAASAALERLNGKLSPKQLRSIVEAAAFTIALWVGAVSAGKTFASLIAFLIAVLRVPQGERIVIVGRTLKTIEGNVLSLLMDPKRFGLLSKEVVHTTGASTAIILGRVVELIGAPTVLAEGNIRGGTIALVYVDEATLIPEGFFDMLETRLRVEGARMLATTNPASFNHWLRIKYILAPKDHDMVVFHFTMRDNPGLPAGYVLRMVRANVGMFFQRFILGLWTNAAGAIYDMWDPEKFVIPWSAMPKIDRILCVGIDYGASHATSAVMLGITAEFDDAGKYRPRLVVMDEWRYKVDHEAGVASMAPSLMAQEIGKWLRQQHTPGVELLRTSLVFVDPSALGFREELQRVRIMNNAADNEVLAGIADISSLFAQERILITDRCVGILEEITEYSWDAKKSAGGIDEPVKINDDSMDAFRYAVRSSRGLWFAIFRAAYGLAA